MVSIRHNGPPTESISDRLNIVTTVTTMFPFSSTATRQCPLLKLETLKVRRTKESGVKGSSVSTNSDEALKWPIYRRVPLSPGEWEVNP